VRVGQEGRLDEVDLQDRLREHAGRVALLAVTGASNVTGIVNPVHTYARWAHAVGARIVVDAAQLAPHRAIGMRPGDDPEHLDFVAFSAHKLYAPFGVGVLVGPRDVFAAGDPDDVGGGTVDSVDWDRVRWTALPEREEAGTPCITGAVALAAALREYEAIGWACINAHEARLTRHALEVLRAVPGLTLYGDADPARAADRLGVVAFNLGSLPHGLVAAVLAHEWGIATRDGCFCAHPYVKTLLGVGDAASRQIEERIAQGDRSDLPGAVRVSFGLYNTIQEIDVLGEALHAVAAGRHDRGYVLDPHRGEYLPAGYTERFTEYCPI
jgi:selenocysteine lyase/cysteine desulfurase